MTPIIWCWETSVTYSLGGMVYGSGIYEFWWLPPSCSSQLPVWLSPSCHCVSSPQKKSRHLAECCGLHPKFPIGSCLKTWSPACGAVWYGYGISRKWSLLCWRKWVTGHRSWSLTGQTTILFTLCWQTTVKCDQAGSSLAFSTIKVCVSSNYEPKVNLSFLSHFCWVFFSQQEERKLIHHASFPSIQALILRPESRGAHFGRIYSKFGTVQRLAWPL